MAEKEAAKEEAPAGPKMVMGMPLMMFIFVVLNVVVTAGSFAFVYHATLVYKKPAITDEQVVAEVAKKEAKKEPGAEAGFFTVTYPETTVTLRSEPGSKGHFATVEATLVCATEDCQEQVKAIRAKVEDKIQTVLSSRSYTELNSLETKFRVKHEILGHVNSFLKDTAAVDLLFTAFLIQ